MRECDSSKIHISSNLLLSIWLLIMLDTLLLVPSLQCNTSLHFTTLHLTTLHRLRVFQNRVLREIFGPERDEVTGKWIKLHSEELNDLYCALNIARVIKSRRMGWARHVARRGRVEACTGFWWWNLRERDHLGDPGLDLRIGSGMWGYGLDRAGSR